MASDFELGAFVFDTVKTPHPTILAVGKRFAGKSTMSTSICSKYDVPRWMAWCGTRDTKNYWAKRFGGAKVCTYGSDEEGIAKLEEVVSGQEDIVERYELMDEPVPRKYTVGLIFDDVTADEAFSKCKILKDLFSNGRHYLAVILICVQFLTQIPPQVRGNTDYLFMLHNTKQNITILFKEYISCDLTPRQFARLLQLVTSQEDMYGKRFYNALVFDNTVAKSDMSEIFSIHRSGPDFNPKEVLLGDPEWREAMAQYMTPKQYEAQRKLRRIERQRRIRAIQEARKSGHINKYSNDMPDHDDFDAISDDSGADVDIHEFKQRGGNSFRIIIPKKRFPSVIKVEDDDAKSVTSQVSHRTESGWRMLY